MRGIIDLYNLCANLFEYLDHGKGRYHMMSFAGHANCSTPAVELPASSQDGFLGSP